MWTWRGNIIDWPVILLFDSITELLFNLADYNCVSLLQQQVVEILHFPVALVDPGSYEVIKSTDILSRR